MKRFLVPAVALAAALAALVAFAQNRALPEPRAVAPRGPLLPTELAIVALFEATAPSVAYITTEHVQRTSLFTTALAQGAGSGFVWDAKGHIVTNNQIGRAHV